MHFIGGCSFAPRYKAPSAPYSHYPADTWQSSPERAAANAGEISWQHYFQDGYLRKLIQLALEHNKDLQTALLRVDEARAAFGIQRADLYPNINGQIGSQRSRVPADLNLTGKPLETTQYQVSLGLSSWELDFWGRVRNLKEAALENFLATNEARRAFTISLIAQVADGYFSLRELDERIVLAQKTIASRQKSFQIFTRRVEVGSTSRMDLTQVETLLTQALLLCSQLKQARAAQAHAMVPLVGTQLPDSVVVDLMDDETILEEVRVGLPSELLTQRPDIIAAEHRLKAEHANIGAARAAFFPRITLTGSFGSASAELSGLFDTGSKAWSFVPNLTLPIFDGERNRSGLNLAVTRRNLALQNYEKTIQVAFREVSDALSARHWLTEQVRIQQATLRAQSERARLAKLRYDFGAAPYLEVLDAERDVVVAEQQLVQTRRLLLSSRLNLYAALGGGAQSLPLSSSMDQPVLMKAMGTE